MATIAEKLTTIADNQQKVYDAGYNIGLAKGKTDANKSFWNNYQLYGGRNSYSYAFFGNGWNDSTYNPQYDILTEPKTDRARYMFAWSGIVDTKVSIEINGALRGIEEGIFLGCKHLTTIKELYINNYNAEYYRWFEGCVNLRKIAIKGQIKNNGFDIHWSKNLTAESLYSIIDALSTSKTGLTITLPTTAEANYNANPPEGAPATWLELVGDGTEEHPGIRPNWTIAYA